MIERIVKSPNEKFPVRFNFSADLIAGEVISSVVVTCVNAATGVSSKTAIVDSETIASPELTVVVKAGTEGDEHYLQAIATTSFGNTYDRDLYLAITSVVDDSFTKQPGDAFLFDVDFTNRLSSSETVSSATAAATKEADGTAASVVGTPFVITPKVAVPVLSGTDGETYLLAVKGTTSLGYVHEKFIRMNVQEY